MTYARSARRFPAGAKYAAYKPQICARGVFRSSAEDLLPAKKQFSVRINGSLVSACKGKNKGKYIRFEHLTD